MWSRTYDGAPSRVQQNSEGMARQKQVSTLCHYENQNFQIRY